MAPSKRSRPTAQLNAVIIPRKALEESPRSKLRRLCKRTQMSDEEDNDDSEMDEEESAGSSADEYAEGLGFAGDRRDRGNASSGFTFDQHPREEYFEQPQPNRSEIVGEGLQLLGGSCKSSTALGKVLSKLEALEERQEALKTRSLRGQAAQSGRVAEAEDVILEAFGNPEPSLVPAESLPALTGNSMAELRAHAACLAVLSRRDDVEASLRVLEALDRIEVTTQNLRDTGIGRELSKPFWQKHPKQDISTLSARLLERWKRSVREAKVKR